MNIEEEVKNARELLHLLKLSINKLNEEGIYCYLEYKYCGERCTIPPRELLTMKFKASKTETY